MNTLILALKSFFHAFKDPKAAQTFIQGEQEPKKQKDRSNVYLLGLLQKSGRIIDFFKEDIQGYTDAQVGAAVRKIHADCSQVLEEHFSVRPVRRENEGEKVEVPDGYDPLEVKVTGKVKGSPPYRGVLIHKGWKVEKNTLNTPNNKGSEKIIMPAEVEVK